MERMHFAARAATRPSSAAARPIGASRPGTQSTEIHALTVVVVAADALIGEGTVAYLRSRPEIQVIERSRVAGADVVLMVADAMTNDVFATMDKLADEAGVDRLRFVVVADGIREQHVMQAARRGLVSLLSRKEVDLDQVVRAMIDLRSGRLQLPQDTAGWLAGRLRTIERDVLYPRGLTASGLEQREADVLRMLADGLDTPEIARQLNFSERTVKNTIYGVIARHKLTNRAHAIAFAIRSGAI